MSSVPPNKRKDSPLSHHLPRKKIKENHSSDGDFQVVKASLVLSVPPIFAANPRAGVEELLDSMIMR